MGVFTGGPSNDVLTGTADADTLDGAAGADTMSGGKGNDTYIVDDPGDLVNENAGEGSDTVKTLLLNYALGANVENLTYTGTGAFYGTGNSLSNLLVTSSALATLAGGAGDDYYQVANTATTIIEQANAGKDTVVATANYALPDNVETLKIYGLGPNGGYTGVGNGAANLLTGDSNAHTLVGLGGDDTLTGGGGKDTFAFDTGSGHDILTDWNTGDTIRLGPGYGFTSYAQVQGALAQVGSNVVLTLSSTDDVTFQNTTLDKFATANFQLPLNFSTLTLSFSDEFNGPLSLYNPMTGQGTWFTQFGYKGANNAGLHTLASTGEREIFVDPGYAGTGTTPLGINPFNVHDGQLDITVANTPSQDLSLLYNRAYTSGLLTTQASSTQTYGYYEIRAQMPVGQGAWPAFWLLPSSGVNPPEADILEAHGSAPTLNVATLHDASLPGGAQGTAVFLPNLSGFHTYGFLWGPQTLTWYVDGAPVAKMATPADMNQPMYMLLNLAVDGFGAITPTNLPTPLSVDYVRTYATADTLAATPGFTFTGTGYGDTLVGGAGNDTITGGLGDDVLDGRAGTNTATYSGPRAEYSVTADAVSGGYWIADTGSAGEGRDHLVNIAFVQFADGTYTPDSLVPGNGVSLTGGPGPDSLVGGIGVDTLQGAGGDDTLDGGAGTDIAVYAGPRADYHVFGDPTTGGYVVLNTGGEGEGVDRLVNIETLAFSDGRFAITDLADGQYIRGTSAAEQLSGSSGADSIFAAAGNDTLIGAAGNDTLDGGTGRDTLIGGPGDDTYYVDNLRDVVVEKAGEGYDTVYTTLTLYTAPKNVEAVTYLGSGAFTGYANATGVALTGGTGGDRLIGNNGPDVLDGGGGADTLTGGKGADSFVLNGPGGGTDRITDFKVGTDHVVLHGSEFGISSLSGVAFVNGSTATGAQPTLIYTSTGSLYWDPTGGAANDKVLVATFDLHPHLSLSDFVVG